MKRNRFGKIVATIGPSSNAPEMLEKLFLSGVDVFRLNCSHGTIGLDHTHKLIRDLGKKHGYTPTIIWDLQGPKLRVGKFANGKEYVNTGDKFCFDLDTELGDRTRVNLPHPEIFQAMQVGATFSVDDGKVKVKAVECSHDRIVVEVLVGGVISNAKGVNVPDVVLPIPVLTRKDKEDLEFGLTLGVDWVAISFVQTAQDILDAKKFIAGRARVCSKIEKPSAIQNIEEVVETSDAIMVARGDLAVETAHEMAPILQRTLVDACHRYGRPIIVATQMLESMIESPTPTRAETSDVATAVYMSADATMLSAEAAVGKYPLEAVTMMNSVIEAVENDPQWIDALEYNAQDPDWTIVDACAYGVESMASISTAACIVMFSDNIENVIRLSRARPDAPVIVATTCSKLSSQAGLLWGVRTVLVEETKCMKDMVEKAKKLSLDLGYAEENDSIVVYADGDTPNMCITIA